MSAKLTDADREALGDASWKKGRAGWEAEIERIIAERVAAERERIAQVIEDHAANCGRTGPHHTTFATAARIARGVTR